MSDLMAIRIRDKALEEAAKTVENRLIYTGPGGV